MARAWCKQMIDYLRQGEMQRAFRRSPFALQALEMIREECMAVRGEVVHISIDSLENWAFNFNIEVDELEAGLNALATNQRERPTIVIDGTKIIYNDFFEHQAEYMLRNSPNARAASSDGASSKRGARAAGEQSSPESNGVEQSATESDFVQPPSKKRLSEQDSQKKSSCRSRTGEGEGGDGGTGRAVNTCETAVDNASSVVNREGEGDSQTRRRPDSQNHRLAESQSENENEMGQRQRAEHRASPVPKRRDASRRCAAKSEEKERKFGADRLADLPEMNAFFDELPNLIDAAGLDARPLRLNVGKRQSARNNLAKLVLDYGFAPSEVEGALRWVFTSGHKAAAWWRVHSRDGAGIHDIVSLARTPKDKNAQIVFKTLYSQWIEAERDTHRGMSADERAELMADLELEPSAPAPADPFEPLKGMAPGRAPDRAPNERERGIARQIWPKVLAAIERRAGPDFAPIWLDGVQCEGLTDKAVWLAAPAGFIADHLERLYGRLISDSVQAVLKSMDLPGVSVFDSSQRGRNGPSAAAGGRSSPRPALCSDFPF